MLREPFSEGCDLYVQAMIPVLRERYQCTYEAANSFKPLYKKIDEEYLREEVVFGILTNQDLGYIPPVTLGRQDQLSDQHHHHVMETFFFEPMLQNKDTLTCRDVATKIERLRNLDFPLSPDTSSLDDDDVEMIQIHDQEQLDIGKVKAFNETLLSDLFKKDLSGDMILANACKNYLLVPLRITEREGEMTYSIDHRMINESSMPV